MHLYVIARGHIDRLRRWENDLAARYYPYKYTKNESPGMVQLAVRPVQLYEIVFPKAATTNVLQTIFPYQNEIMNKYAFGLRKMLGLKKIPDIRKAGLGRKEVYQGGILSDYVGVIGVGIKEDRFENGIEKL